MAKEKLFRYAAVKELPNVRELSGHDAYMADPIRGTWADWFGNDNPIILELACGKGDYTLELARRHPDRNFIGVDVKGDRIWKGATQALAEGLSNVRFLRIYIDHITAYFEPGEVAEIWITFPDPYLVEKKAHKRLTHPEFLDRYRRILREDGLIRLKTDDATLDAFTLETLEAGGHPIAERVDDVHGGAHAVPDLDILTYYERKHLEQGLRIRYTAFRLSNAS